MADKVFAVGFVISNAEHLDKLKIEKQIFEEMDRLRKDLKRKYEGRATISLIEM